MSRVECLYLAASITTAFLIVTDISAYTFNTVINASVLGTQESNLASLYSSIADVMLREENRDGNSSVNKYVPNYCKLVFTAWNFDTSSADAMFNSLEQARLNFESSKVAVAVGPYMDVFSSTDYVITQQTHILTSAAGHSLGVTDPSKVISLLPEPSSMSQALSQIVRLLGWSNVAFLAQDDFSPVLGLRHENIQVWPMRLHSVIGSSTDPELQRNLLKLRESKTEKYILHSNNRDVVMHVLDSAHRLHLLHHSIDWLVTYPDFTDLVQGNSQNWAGSLYGIQLLRQEKIPKNVSHLTGNISRLDLGLAIDVVGLIRHILWAEWADCSRERIVSDYVIPPEAFTWQIKHGVGPSNPYDGALGQYTWGKRSNVRTNFSIDVMKFDGDLHKIGTIAFNMGVPNVTLKDIPRKHVMSRANSFGKEEILKVVTKQTDPFVIKRGNNYTGFSLDLLFHISQKVGFKYEVYEVEDLVDDNGDTINGMVHALTSGNASMAVGGLEVTAAREKVISFSYTVVSSQASILVKKADSPINFFQFLGPFSTDLWLMILAFMMVAGASLYMMSRYDPTQQGAPRHFDLKESLWYSLNIFLQGSTDYSPQTTAMRAVIAFFWFCVLIIEAAYTANLAAFLTLQQIDDRIKSIYDLAGQTKMKYGVERGSEIMHFFQAQKEDPYQRMWAIMKLKESESILSNRTEIIDKVKAGKFVFISDGVTNGYYANQHCGLESIEQNFQSKDFGLGFPRGAPYLDDINTALLELREDGVLDSLREKWWSIGRNCSGRHDKRSISQKVTAELELTNMIGVFIVLAVVIVLATSVHIGEKLFKRSKKRRKKRENLNSTNLSETKAQDNHFLK